MTRPRLMLSLPNSGSTWFGELLAEHWGARYEMEFFNPLRTERHEAILSRQFGCELVSCFRNIAEPGDERIDDDIRATWGAENLTFTKEVFSPLKLPAFARHFDCFVLLRSAANSLPPKRLRIWSFYEHAWYAIAMRWRPRFVARTARARALEAHAWMWQRILEDARQLEVPVIYWEDLVGDPLKARVAMRLAFPVDDGLLEKVLATRAFRGR